MTPSDAVENADWIRSRLHPFNAYDVGSVVPTGFAAYARILHPAFTREREVRWAEVATWSGRLIHPEVQFHALVPSLSLDAIGTEPFNFPPRNGVLPESQAQALAGLLSEHTTTRDKCWFCLWDGYGDFNAGAFVRAYKDSFAGRWQRWRTEHVRVSLAKPKPRRVPGKRVTPNAQRSYFLFSGPVTKAAGWRGGPNIWWPEDRAWCVASEIDLPGLEALPSQVTDGITYDSDRLNAPIR